MKYLSCACLCIFLTVSFSSYAANDLVVMQTGIAEQINMFFYVLLIMGIGVFFGLALDKRTRTTALLAAAYFLFLVILYFPQSYSGILNSFYNEKSGYLFVFLFLISALLVTKFFYNITLSSPIAQTLIFMTALFDVCCIIAILGLPMQYFPLHGIVAFVASVMTLGLITLTSIWRPETYGAMKIIYALCSWHRHVPSLAS
jgi:uncharacterized membrane protein